MAKRTVRVRDDLDEFVQQEAERRDRSYAYIINKVIEAYKVQQERRAGA